MDTLNLLEKLAKQPCYKVDIDALTKDTSDNLRRAFQSNDSEFIKIQFENHSHLADAEAVIEL